MTDPARLGLDLSQCDREPIHIPGAIQPHGVLLALADPAGPVLQASANVADLLGRPAAEILGQTLPALLGDEQAAVLADAWANCQPERSHHQRLQIGGRAFDAIVHHFQGMAISEFEPVVPWPVNRDLLLGLAVDRLGRATGLAALCDFAVQAVQEVTGFERVMLYRFDDDGHGTVLAETRPEVLETYLGLHYPASDIPQQARALYRLNWLRLIPDAAYTPVPLVPALRPDTGQPLDLSFAVLRSVSPVHREYLANFGARAAMSLSLVVGDRLWGLVTCADRAPRFVPFELRLACETIARLLSLQINAFETVADRQLRGQLQRHGDGLTRAMRAADGDVLAALAQCPEDLLALTSATGAALVNGDQIATVGDTPPLPAVRELADWLWQSPEPVFASHRLASAYPPAAADADQASGLLAISLPKPTRHQVLWFRPEVVKTVKWAGNPDKAVEAAPAGLRLHPRRSFELWQAEVRHSASRWHPVEIDMAAELRRSAIEIDLARQVVKERAAVVARDELVAVVSHDLRNPLNLIQLQAGLMLKTLPADEPSQSLQAPLLRIQHAAKRMGALIQDLLDLAKIEAGRFSIDPEPFAPAALIDDAIAVMAPLAKQKGIVITHRVPSLPAVIADPERIYQVLANLISNAIKFTPAEGSITVSARARGNRVEFAVTDTGPGIPGNERQHLFERYWQSAQHRRAGSGLGLFIAAGIVAAHRGCIGVESRRGRGSTFCFTLPVAATADLDLDRQGA